MAGTRLQGQRARNLLLWVGPGQVRWAGGPQVPRPGRLLEMLLLGWAAWGRVINKVPVLKDWVLEVVSSSSSCLGAAWVAGAGAGRTVPPRWRCCVYPAAAWAGVRAKQVFLGAAKIQVPPGWNTAYVLCLGFQVRQVSVKCSHQLLCVWCLQAGRHRHVPKAAAVAGRWGEGCSKCS